MIGEAIQATVAAIIPNTFAIVVLDDEITAPYCVHTETELEPTYLKAGLLNYNYAVEILIIDELPDNVSTKVALVRAAIEALPGTTVNSTAFEQVIFEGDDPGFNEESRMYANNLRFTIETKTR
jgi:hypothetical protein